ncbi:helix-turn-helix domain-containing protein [Savagea sp. SN6]|uniref:Helix-turn-helix domain-containing protein n=1 Tax=Savagea serpentis TaxID=2785297 RepID=A0A8J7G135_9BACL|nr:helix-turn-helix domain-containing protein [Savagea serpentis]MBF4500215.1 helix-turn-helix domain-containing protein [Savagea serpentis]
MTIYLNDYKTFNSKNELNEAVAAHLSNNKLNKTERDVLWMLSQYSVKYYGASHLKVSTIVKHVGKSDKTIRRALNKLQSLNIIRKIETTRKITGGKGANMYQILPYDQSKMTNCDEPIKPVVTTSKHNKNNNEPFSSLTINNNTDDTQDNNKNKTKKLIKKSLLAKIPSKIADILDTFFETEKEIYEIYGTILKAKSKAPFAVQFEQNEGAFCGAIVDVMRLYKQNKIKNLQGYLYATIKRTAIRIGLLSFQY